MCFPALWKSGAADEERTRGAAPNRVAAQPEIQLLLIEA
jgi:hypothetical protein